MPRPSRPTRSGFAARIATALPSRRSSSLPPVPPRGLGARVEPAGAGRGGGGGGGRPGGGGGGGQGGSGQTGVGDTLGMFDPSTGFWFLRNQNNAGPAFIAPFSYGGVGWKGVVGDWNGDGGATIGVVDTTAQASG